MRDRAVALASFNSGCFETDRVRQAPDRGFILGPRPLRRLLQLPVAPDPLICGHGRKRLGAPSQESHWPMRPPALSEATAPSHLLRPNVCQGGGQRRIGDLRALVAARSSHQDPRLAFRCWGDQKGIIPAIGAFREGAARRWLYRDQVPCLVTVAMELPPRGSWVGLEGFEGLKVA